MGQDCQVKGEGTCEGVEVYNEHSAGLVLAQVVCNTQFASSRTLKDSVVGSW